MTIAKVGFHSGKPDTVFFSDLFLLLKKKVLEYLCKLHAPLRLSSTFLTFNCGSPRCYLNLNLTAFRPINLLNPHIPLFLVFQASKQSNNRYAPALEGILLYETNLKDLKDKPYYDSDLCGPNSAKFVHFSSPPSPFCQVPLLLVTQTLNTSASINSSLHASSPCCFPFLKTFSSLSMISDLSLSLSWNWNDNETEQSRNRRPL